MNARVWPSGDQTGCVASLARRAAPVFRLSSAERIGRDVRHVAVPRRSRNRPLGEATNAIRVPSATTAAHRRWPARSTCTVPVRHLTRNRPMERGDPECVIARSTSHTRSRHRAISAAPLRRALRVSAEIRDRVPHPETTQIRRPLPCAWVSTRASPPSVGRSQICDFSSLPRTARNAMRTPSHPATIGRRPA